MKVIVYAFLIILIMISCSQKSNNTVSNENIETNENLSSDTVQDMSLEEALLKYEGNPSMDIITNLLASGNINNTLTETTNIVNAEDTEYDLSVTFDEGTTALMIASYYGYAD